MIPAERQRYNQEFTKEKYETFLEALHAVHPGQLDFRVAETPVFIPKDFTQKVLDACEHMVDVLFTPGYLQQSEAAIPKHLRVPNDDAYPQFIAFDFGICQNAAGEIEPQLIELQGFPSLFAYQVLFPEVHGRHLYQPSGFSNFLNGYNKNSYLQLLKEIILGDCAPEEVVLLEIFPEQQKTRIDFHCTEDYLGIKTVCLTRLIRDGRELFYETGGKRQRIRRIYNRLIFDDLFQQVPEVQEKGKIFQQDLDVTWVPHPNWFYRVSKYSLPFLDHPYIPRTEFLDKVSGIPRDLENYVVKPLFSFAGQGVIIDVTREAIAAIPDPQNWILQRKVSYAAIIETPSEPAKAELRIFYFWPPGAKRPIAVNNLARLSKGKMVGVRYNKDKDWVGGSFCLFEH